MEGFACGKACKGRGQPGLQVSIGCWHGIQPDSASYQDQSNDMQILLTTALADD